MTAVLLALPLLTLHAAPASAANGQVYMVMATDCGPRHASFAQSGFRARFGDETGLVTALHGVVGCRHVTARHESRQVYVHDLVLAKVDVSRDVAFYASDALAHESASALLPVPDVSGKGWKVVGHPQSVLMQLSHDVLLHEEPRVQLRRLMPISGGSAKLLEARESPSLESEVFSLKGTIQAGYSGAPILNPDGRVVAVAQGGLAGGFADVNWAVPIMDIQWKSEAEIRPRLQALATLNVQDLFATPWGPDLEERIRSGGARVSGRILYNNEIAARVTKAYASIELMDVATRQEAPVNAQYDNQTGVFIIENVPPGKYTPFIRLEAGYPFHVESGGDYFSRLSGLNDDIVVAPHDEAIQRDLKVVEVIHLVKPVDNQVQRRSTQDPRETLYQSFYGPSAEVFEWEPVAGAVQYQVVVHLYNATTGSAISTDVQNIQTNRFEPHLGVSPPNTYYAFFVTALNQKQELIGNFIEYYRDGTGGLFEFTVVPPPR